MKTRPLIALDADGVLLDYSLAYAHLWERAFGYFPKELDKNAYWPLDRWEVEALDGERLSIPDGQVKFPHPWPPQIPPGRTTRL